MKTRLDVDLQYKKSVKKMSEKLERETEGGNGSTGTKVSDSCKGKEVVTASQAVAAGRGGFQYLDNSTIPFFFTNFPDNASKLDLRRLFMSYGKVEEVFIPNKLDKNGKRFGFVKFKEVRDEEDLAVRLDEVWLWKSRLKVNRALFRRAEKTVVEKKKEVVKPVTKVVGGAKPSSVNGRTFRGVLLNEEDREAAEFPCFEVLPSKEMMELLKVG
jgi:hypothetical protein